jgi:hypothetical protein
MIANMFEGTKIYTGCVTRIYPATDDDVQLWHVVYSDGDEADLDEREMVLAHKLYMDEIGGEEGDDNSSSDEQYNPCT